MPVIIDCFGGPGRAVGRACVSVCVQTRNKLPLTYLFVRIVHLDKLTMSRSCSKVKVVGQSSKSQEEKKSSATARVSDRD